MTQDTQHHEDVAVVTIHFHEDELLELARLLSPAPRHQRMPWAGSEPVVLAAKGRMLAAADTVLHAQRARSRTRKA